MKRLLTVQMGEEYYYSREYNKALTVLSHVLWEYRLERWYPLVSSILLTALKCSFLSANLQEYITLGLEAVSTWVQCSVDDKSLIQANVNSLLQGNPPLPLPSLSQVEVNLAETLWKDFLAARDGPLIFTIPMSNVIPFVECKTRFISKQFRADEHVVLHVYLRINCPQPLKFSKLSVMFNNPAYNSQCELPGAKSILGENGSSLYVPPGKTRLFTFSFLPSPVDVNGTISVNSLALQLGSEKHACAVLVWTEGSQETIHSPPRLDFPFSSSCTANLSSTSHSSLFNKLPEELSTRIVPREPRLSVQTNHYSPVLLGEIYPLQVTVMSEEINIVQNVTLSIGLSPRSTTKEFTAHTYFIESLECSTEASQHLQSINMGALNPGEMVNKWVFLKATSVGSRELLIQVSYMTEVDVDGQILECHCIREEILNLPVQEPLKFSTKILNLKFQPVEYIRLEEPFLLSIDIQSCTNLPLMLNGGILSLAQNVSSTDQECATEILGLHLDEGETATECFSLITSIPSTEPILLGSYTLSWRRESKENLSLPWVQLEASLPQVKVFKASLFAEADCPSHGWVRTPLSLTYTLHNQSSNIQELVLMMESSDAFMYAGNRKLHFWILPRSSHRMCFNLYPLVSGYVQLPKLKLTMNPGKQTSYSLDDLIYDMLPSHMFIMPQGKNVEGRSLTNGRSP